MAEYYAKSIRGRQVLRDRHYPLPRSARNLLLILDASKPVRQWLQMVHGVGWAEVGVLEQAGLIEPVPEAGPAETRPAPLPSDFGPVFRPDELAELTLPIPLKMPRLVAPPVCASQEADLPCSAFMPLVTRPRLHSTLGHADLYDSLNALARQTLGLFRGYRYTLRIEKAQDLDELEQVASDFVAEVERLRGRAVARTVRRALGLEDLGD
ncbi:MAG: hypothetical protein RL654_2809 [Pseudomonadota bacterium]